MESESNQGKTGAVVSGEGNIVSTGLESQGDVTEHNSEELPEYHQPAVYDEPSRPVQEIGNQSQVIYQRRRRDRKVW